ncbi:hypothetical protein EJ02DRAFT_258550 [Clathrospora elynae]|uniref:Uncharacterized protein n=1 Tax=Clathrospora elynae TaxID=706981 RepID=A0A6A5SHX1_9PLEO|nr:hypothetical protein EJ02DRAFT_258550 [Clathrospora elynae]
MSAFQAITTRHRVLQVATVVFNEDRHKNSGHTTLVTKSIEPATLSTSRLVYAEAQPFLQGEMTRLRAEPTRNITDIYSLSSIASLTMK